MVDYLQKKLIYNIHKLIHCLSGFKVSNTSCCNVDTSLGGLCLPNSKMCTNRNDYVFWDAFHPSDAANAVLADKLFSRLFPQPPSLAPAPSH